ncbi:ribonuclease H [Bacillus coahuilensis p1.1.43]|uniref:Ribonuclease H n=1 Tax=Bacillus coahuilensis p1.1.43 TaxID=1150625 RepID=A0A147K8R8_9BACI|nr:reverse transcriptase-like protein [Bacillus coahuilensis]KUP06515.1 ribonuclease H [Bacillus coahuilensis p1.1.43]
MIEVYIDGASAGDPGHSGAGVHIRNDQQSESYSIPLGIMNNHQAEFFALLHAVEICEQKGYDMVSFRTDSQAVARAIEKEFVKNPTYREIFLSIQQVLSRNPLFFVKWVPSKENLVADDLSRKAIRLSKAEEDA